MLMSVVSGELVESDDPRHVGFRRQDSLSVVVVLVVVMRLRFFRRWDVLSVRVGVSVARDWMSRGASSRWERRGRGIVIVAPL